MGQQTHAGQETIDGCWDGHPRWWFCWRGRRQIRAMHDRLWRVNVINWRLGNFFISKVEQVFCMLNEVVTCDCLANFLAWDCYATLPSSLIRSIAIFFMSMLNEHSIAIPLCTCAKMAHDLLVNFAGQFFWLFFTLRAVSMENKRPQGQPIRTYIPALPGKYIVGGNEESPTITWQLIVLPEIILPCDVSINWTTKERTGGKKCCQKRAPNVWRRIGMGKQFWWQVEIIY